MLVIRKIVILLSFVCLVLALNSCKTKGGNTNQTQTENVDASETILEWEGAYSGVIPCADCAGIETKLSLNGDNTYQISRKYLEKDDEVFENQGTFVLDETGSIITLEGLDKTEYPTMYKVGENQLLQLDLEGNVIEGELADAYILKKE
jgi:uncharacterized lipoprotein NlpE involved in copper resistance